MNKFPFFMLNPHRAICLPIIVRFKNESIFNFDAKTFPSGQFKVNKKRKNNFENVIFRTVNFVQYSTNKIMYKKILNFNKY